MADPDNSTLEDARKRARRRLVGAVVLALVAAVVLPMFLESDPKPLGPDVQIQIPAIDDARFQNRLTRPDASKAPVADKAAPPVPSEPAKAPRTAAGTGVVTPPPAAPEGGDPNVSRTDAQESARAPASAEPNATTQPAPAVVPPAPAGVAPKPAAPARPAPVASSAATQPDAAPAKKSAAPVPPTAAPSVPPPAPAASLPAFSLTATAPAPGAASTPDPAQLVASAPPVAQGEFVVQLGAFVTRAVAEDLAEKAREQGVSVFLEAVTTKSGQVHRVRVGPFVTRAEADAAAGKLKAAGFTAVTRPRKDAALR